MRIPNDSHHVLGCCPLAKVHLEAVLQPFDRRFALERRQLGTEHEVARIAQLVGVRSNGEEGLDGELGEHFVALRFATTHQAHHLMIELEAVGLELDPLDSVSFDAGL